MASKPKTQAQRRDEFFRALDSMRIAYDGAGYIQGCRASAPDRHDNAETRERENARYREAARLQAKCISLYNAAVRAARRAL